MENPANQSESTSSQPYRLFFFMGWIFALYGGLLWLRHEPIPIREHSEILAAGFLLAYSAGFLLTAIPRITAAPPAPRGLQFLILIFLSLGVISSALQTFASGYLFYLIASLFLAMSLAFCFLRRKYDPPPFFIFVALGLFCGMLGQTLILSFAQVGDDIRFFLLGKDLFYQAMILLFVVGIGSRIIPVLLGWKDQVFDPEARPPRTSHLSFAKKLPLHLILGSLAIILSFVIERFLNAFSGQLLRAVLVGSLAFGPWKLFYLPKKRTYHSFFLWLSAWALIIGLVAYAFSESFEIHWLHLVYLGSFSLMTVMVASHVLIEHEDLDPKRKSFSILGLTGALLIGATLFRLLVVFFPEYYFIWMKASALCWGASLILWPLALFAPQKLRL